MSAVRPALPSVLGRPSGRVLWLLVGQVLLLAFLYVKRIDEPHLGQRREMHDRIVQGTVESPFRYRVLVPFAAEGIRAALEPTRGASSAFHLAYAVTDTLGFLVLVLGLFFYLRRWFSDPTALIGVLLACAITPLTMSHHYYQPWSYLEGGLLAFGLLAIAMGRWGWAVGLTVVATLNRETGLLLAVAALIEGGRLAVARRGWRGLRQGTLVLLVWGVTYGALRLVRGHVPHVHGWDWLLAENTAPGALRRTLELVVVFYGVGWIQAAIGWRRISGFLLSGALLFVPFAALYVRFGVWWEVRQFVPTFPMLLPLILAYVVEVPAERRAPEVVPAT